ncbi:MAG: hypothetical protein E7021_03855 [Alphaproteobacteria bacterium]|nr:hypothetical protein [Alphaproteobacteria bacterium]
MYKNVPKTLQIKIKKAADIINSHNGVVDTMLVAKGKDFYGYQPYPQPKKEPASKVPKERMEELSHAFEEAQKALTKEKVELLVCFVSLKEGGVAVFVAQKAVDRRLSVFEELKKMEEHHAKIS